MNGAAPALSVVLPVRNGGRFLRAALKSLQAQTHEDFEVLVQDDGSSDGSAHVVADDFARWDERFRLEVGPPRGVVAAANRAAARARSDLLVRMDADDLCHPERLEKMLAFARAQPEVGCFASRVHFFPRENVGPGTVHYETWINSVLTPDEIWRDRFVEYPLPNPSILVRKELFERLAGYREGDFPEDYDFFLRAAAAGTAFAKHPEVLLEWREGEHRTTRHDSRYGLDRFRALKVEHLLPLLARLGRPVGIIGAGPDGKSLAKLLLAAGQPLRCFVDVHPGRIGNEIQGTRVHGYEDLGALAPCYFLAAVGQKGARAQVRAALDAAGLCETSLQGDGDYLCVQ